MNKDELVRTEEKTEKLVDLVIKGQEYKEQLLETLSDIKVPVRSVNPDVLEAIASIFGNEYIDNENSFITFEMFTQCTKILRNVGRATAAEFA